jgi:hypothetical protein
MGVARFKSPPNLVQNFQLELDFVENPSKPQTAEIIPFEPRTEWSDQAITDLREGLLWDNFSRLLDGRAGYVSKRDVMDWLMSPDITPFSFVTCCWDLGYSPVSLREKTLDLISRNS